MEELDNRIDNKLDSYWWRDLRRATSGEEWGSGLKIMWNGR